MHARISDQPDRVGRRGERPLNQSGAGQGRSQVGGTVGSTPGRIVRFESGAGRLQVGGTVGFHPP
eukprot:174650-Pyramimonas_sp.AAC.1